MKSSSRTAESLGITPESPLLILFGPTGVGKTDFLRRTFRGTGEIISADALQVYRGFDIGTAKPEEALQKEIPHHLIDIRNPEESYSSGEFVRDAEALIPQIRRRGRIPVVSGGTAFYLKNLVCGMPELPPVPSELRQEIREELRREGVTSLRNRLKTVDAESFRRIAPRDTYRLCRALEVYAASGRPLSSYPVPAQPRFPVRLIGLYRPRQELYRRINQRVTDMFQQGLLAEVRRLVSGGLTEETEAMKGIGYREFWQWRRQGCWDIQLLADQIRRNTRRYAKRQITFFGKIPGVEWFRPGEEGLTERCLPGIMA